jgi:hypothetical protein
MMIRCEATSTSLSSQRLSNTMPLPFTSDTPSRALAQSSVSSCSTQFTRAIASHGCRISLRSVDSSSVRKTPGANAWGLLGTRLGTLTSHGPLLKRPRCAFAGTSPDKSLEPGGRKSMTKAKRCVSLLTNSHGRSIACSNETQPLLWSHAFAPQGAERVSPAPHSTRQG